MDSRTGCFSCNWTLNVLNALLYIHMKELLIIKSPVESMVPIIYSSSHVGIMSRGLNGGLVWISVFMCDISLKQLNRLWEDSGVTEVHCRNRSCDVRPRYENLFDKVFPKLVAEDVAMRRSLLESVLLQILQERREEHLL